MIGGFRQREIREIREIERLGILMHYAKEARLRRMQQALWNIAAHRSYLGDHKGFTPPGVSDYYRP